MLDFDLAELYNVETRVFNQAVKRNIESFPEEFMFRLTSDEWRILISQPAALQKQSNGNQSISSSQFVMMENLPKNRTGKYLPYAFTEHGVTMLASVEKPYGEKNEHCHSESFYRHAENGDTICRGFKSS